MAKPICVINIDADSLNRGNRITGWSLRQAQDTMQEKFTDYHVLVIPVQNLERAMEVQVYHEKDFTEVQHAELLKIITDSLITSPVELK